MRAFLLVCYTKCMSNEMNPTYRANLIAQARANGNARLTVRANALEAGWNFGFACPDYEVLTSPDGTTEIYVNAYRTGRIKAINVVNVADDKIIIQIGATKNAVTEISKLFA
ncbi:hypothetical protein MYRNA_10 [Mycobacterium phage Myrna]|uniref:Uncharacterized protein n=1 Tax=Mycobacterium phage Myrna TaxID=546805 RepID=B5LJ21_9CAUD|nr:gp10 [Mycobacterium phage Myrna]ACH62018.1 hypothetical protein MYRNA_10 [Mycobacterium phage Myrna]